MLSLEEENFCLEQLIEEKENKTKELKTENKTKELKTEEVEVEDNTLYPLFRNYPNGTPDYYLRLKSKDFQNWKNEVKILFIDKKIYGDKYFYLLKRLGFKVIKQNKNIKDISNFNLIISNDLNEAPTTEKPIIYINCAPTNYYNKNCLFYYDDEKKHKKYNFYFYSNSVESMSRKNTEDFLDAISKIKEKNDKNY